MSAVGRIFQTAWSLLAFLFVDLALSQHILALLGLPGEPLLSFFTRLFLVLGPMAVLLAIVRGARTGLLPLLLLSSWLTAGVILPFFLSPRDHAASLYLWPKIEAYLLVLVLWVLGRHGRWLEAVTWGAIPGYLLLMGSVQAFFMLTGRASAMRLGHTGLDASLILLLPLMSAMALLHSNRGIRIAGMALTACLLVELAMAGSLIAKVGVLADAAVLAMAMPRPSRRYAQIGLMLVIILVAARAGSVTHGLRVVSHMASSSGSALYAHWRQMAMNSGSAGLLLYILFYMSVIITAGRLRLRRDAASQAWGTAGLAALFSYAAANFLPGRLNANDVLWIVFGLVIGGIASWDVQTP